MLSMVYLERNYSSTEVVGTQIPRCRVQGYDPVTGQKFYIRWGVGGGATERCRMPTQVGGGAICVSKCRFLRVFCGGKVHFLRVFCFSRA